MIEPSQDPARANRFRVLQSFVGRVAPPASGATAELDAAAAEILSEFEQRGVEALLLKGRALEALLYGSGNRRAYSDIDLLVRPGHFAAAEAALDDLGYRDAGMDEVIDDIGGVVHAKSWVREARDLHGPSIVDLHRRFPGAQADPPTVWAKLRAQYVTVDVGGFAAFALNESGQAMHVAVHAAQHGDASPKHLSELELALEVWTEDVWRSATRLANEIGAGEIFAAGLRLTDAGAERSLRMGLPPNAELDWKIRHRGERPRGTFHVQALRDASGTTAVLSVVRRSLLPRRAWIAQQHGWASRSRMLLVFAYAMHVARSPFWAVRAWWFERRAARASRRD